jgi:UDP-N-acetylmuramate--alanine ligase
MDVFPAGEMPIPGVSGRVLASRAQKLGKAEVISIDRCKDVIAYLCDACRAGDLVITQGAGDVTSIGPDLIAALRERAGEDAEA